MNLGVTHMPTLPSKGNETVYVVRDALDLSAC